MPVRSSAARTGSRLWPDWSLAAVSSDIAVATMLVGFVFARQKKKVGVNSHWEGGRWNQFSGLRLLLLLSQKNS